MVSALTIVDLGELQERYASYEKFADASAGRKQHAGSRSA